MKLNQQLMAAALSVAVGLGVSQTFAQNDGGTPQQRNRPPGDPAGGNGGQRNFDPAEMQKRMLERTKEQLEITDETEWKALEPLIIKVGEARMAGFCRRIGYSGRVPPAELVERMRTNLLAGSPGSRAGHEFAALPQAEHLALLNDQLRRFNRRIDELLDHISPQHSSNSCSPTPTASTPTSETNPNWPLRVPRMIRRAV